MSPVVITCIIMGIIFSVVILFGYLQGDKIRRELKDNPQPDDGTIYIEGIGYVKAEDLDDFKETKVEPELEKVIYNEYETEEDVIFYPIEDMPLTEERRQWLDAAFVVIEDLFGEDMILSKKMMLPNEGLFALNINNLEEITPLAHQIARIMDIDPNNLEIEFFNNGKKTYDSNSGITNYVGQEKYAGLFLGTTENGKHVISIADNIHNETDRLIATIAHELSHVKLLGENRMDENNEDLTDMLPLFFGLGIFSANSAFKFDTFDGGWSHSNLGYLSQMDWGYLFALYAYVRHEENPEWLKYLNKSIARDCERATDFIRENEDLIFQTTEK